jgi:plasmid stability protein
MGLRSWVSGLFGDEGQAAGDGDDEMALGVDVERRAGAILEHYGLSGEDARQVAEILAAELTREEGYARSMIADRVARELDVDEERARTIVDTEVASIRNLARVRKFTEQAGGDVRFRWIDSVGHDDSPVCAAVRAEIDDRGPVTLAELREIIREAAGDHPSGTPERADDLVPHERCRHTVVRHVE